MDFWEIGICEMQSFVWNSNICAYDSEKRRWIDVNDDGDGNGEALNKFRTATFIKGIDSISCVCL